MFNIEKGASIRKTAEISTRRLSLSENVLSWALRSLPIKHGKHNLLDRLAPKIWNKTGSLLSFSINEREVRVDPHDLVGWHFAILKSFDPEVIEVLEKACEPAGKEVFWDIGANKGACFSILASKLPSIEVVAIEPQASLFKNNQRNLESICPGRHYYVQAGLGDEEAELKLVIPNSNLGKASLHVEESGPDDDCEVIQIKTASQVAESSGFGLPTIAKIDVEGHELAVFRSLEPCFESRRCKAIVFENHPSEREAFGEILKIVEPYGYAVYGIKKTPWSTGLELAESQQQGVTDYAVIRDDLTDGNQRIASLIRS